MRTWVQSLASLSGLRIWRCHELWCRLQTWLGSCVAVAVAKLAVTAPIGPLAWEPPYVVGVALKRQKKKKKEWVKTIISRIKDADPNTQRGPRDRGSKLYFRGLSQCALIILSVTVYEFTTVVYHIAQASWLETVYFYYLTVSVIQKSRHGSFGSCAPGSSQATIQVWLTKVSLKAWWENPAAGSVSWLARYLSMKL